MSEAHETGLVNAAEASIKVADAADMAEDAFADGVLDPLWKLGLEHRHIYDKAIAFMLDRRVLRDKLAAIHGVARWPLP